MTKVNAAQLTGPALDWAVAKALDYTIFMANHDSGPYGWPGNAHIGALTSLHTVIVVGITGLISIEGPEKVEIWQPTAKWDQCGPLLSRYGIELSRELVDDEKWTWYGSGELLDETYIATSPQEAICIATVVTELGETVEVPTELLKGVK
ncbi:DUF2591 family protein [Cronobacter sakazakii]|nr:DUF2591 family protein [Cronobacter sakazakii]